METYPDCYLSFKAHDDYVSDIQLVPGVIITCSFDGGIRTWDSQTGELRHVMLGHSGGVRCMKVCGSVLFSGSEDCTVRSWNFRDGTPGVTISGHSDWVNCLDQSTDVLFSGSSDSTIRAWKIDSGDQVQSYVGHASSVNCLQVVDRVIYSGAYDMTLRAFDIVSGQCTMILKGDYIGSVRCLLVHNGLIYAGSEEGALRVLDPASGKCLQQLRGHTAHIKSLRLNSSSDQLLSSSGDGVIRSWDLETRECIEFFSNSNTCFYEDHGTYFVGSADGRVKVMRVDSNMDETTNKFSPVKESPEPEPPEPELALWEVVGAVDSVVRKTEATEAQCANIPLIDQKVDQISKRVDQVVQELEGLFDSSAQSQGSASELKQLRMEVQLLSDSVTRATQVSDIAHSAATSGQMGEHTAKAVSLLEGKLGQLQSGFYSPSELPPWFNLASMELERSLVLVEQSLERAIGTVAENHTEQVLEIGAQLKAEARARLQLEHAAKDIADDIEELTASTQEQFKDMEQSVQRLELYDRGVVFQKKIDDALAECSRVSSSSCALIVSVPLERD